ncbi:uncharacterized protein LOC100902746 [Galendromus occidentalis]|uniref:Uncharacterized protein LOC100902746 n=1 Tax=Galendromus occidentalis TaxID=34638 RepID=A0AAJ6QVT8_9ACAR|nr:uncharacterized protein LOC100902746 [Galendromus occidentalis]
MDSDSRCPAQDGSNRKICGAPDRVHEISFRGCPLSLPGTRHKVKLERFHGVELLLVLLDEKSEPYCSLRYLEAALGQPDLETYLAKLGILLNVTKLEDAGILPDIINLRSGIMEEEPLLIKLRAVSCIVKQIGLGHHTTDTITRNT